MIEPGERFISQDTPCISCGYNLRGLDPSGRCPECNTDISASFHGHLLKFANAAWLAKVKQGTDLMYWAIALGILLGFVGGILAAIFGAALAQILDVLLGVAVPVAHLLAVFRITAQEPRVALTEATITWRKTIRIAATFGIASQICFYVPELLTLEPLVVVVLLVSTVAGFLTLFGEFSYAHSFALRIPDLKLARSTNIVKWGLSIVTALLSLGGLAALLISGSGILSTGPAGGAPPAIGGPVFSTGPALGAAATLGCGFTIVYLVFALWACRLLWRYRKAFRAALAEARMAGVARPVTP